MGYKGTSKYIGKFKKDQRIGKWKVTTGDVVLEREAMIECICDCGNTRLVSAYTLVKGTSKQCIDCGNSLQKEKNPAWKGIGKVPGSYIKRVSSKSDKIYVAELFDSQNYKCALTGLPISFTDKTASLDRIDSTKPYKKGNVQWVHKDANIMKNGYNIEYFIKMCKLITEHNKHMDVSEAKSKFVFGNTTNH